MSAAPSAVSPPLRARLGWIATVATVVLLTLWSTHPADTVLNASLDVSNYGSYAHFTAQGFAFGRDVVAMAGPYGFINYGFVYTGELFWTRLALELLVKAGFAVLVLWFFRQSVARLWRWLWLATVFAVAPLIEDTPYDFAVLLAGLYLILHFERPQLRRGVSCGRPPAPTSGTATQTEKSSLRPCLAAAFLALLSLCKGTQLAYALPTLALVGVAAALTREWRRGALIVAAFAGSYLLLWLLAGQNPLDLPAFLRGVQSLASGYNDAMGLDEVPRATHLGLGLLALLVVSALTTAWLARRSLSRLLAALFFAGFAFTQWKHGFVRADGHIFILFLFAVGAALMPALLVPAADASSPADRWPRALTHLLAVASLALALVASDHGHSSATWLHDLRSNFPPRLAGLLHPAATRAQLDAGLAFHHRKYALPALRERIGSGTVDLFGSDHGFIPLNDLAYRPRPVGGGSFNVYTEYLKRLNAAFLLDPARRPDFYLLKPQILDARLLSQDDSRAILPLLYTYEPVATERSVLLLAQKTRPSPPPLPTVLTRQAFRWGATVDIPPTAHKPDEIVLASFDFELNWLGRLRAFFYKPPQVFISLSPPAQGAPIDHRESVRLIPAMLRSPVIFSPVIEDVHDFLNLYTRGPGKRLQDFRITTSHPGLFREDHLHVTFYRVARPPVADRAPALSALTRFPCSNLGAESASPAAFPHYLDDAYVVGFHAASRAVFPLAGTERALDLGFGLEPAAYTGPGATDGVTFAVELQQPGLGAQSLYRRHLDPLHQPADRGTVTDRVILPPVVRPGSTLIVRTDPGPRGDGAWDWSYFTRCDAVSGPYLPGQFPGFASLPVEVAGDYTGSIDTGERAIFMLNAPGRLAFALDGTARHLAFAGGLVAGAYTDNGHTDGAAFIAELVAPDGHVTEVFHRLLDPRINAADRGTVPFAIDLPAHAAGSRLVLRTDPGPAADPSWDWTYVADVHIN